MEVEEITTFQKSFTNDVRKIPPISETHLECKDNKEVSINETEAKTPQPIFEGKCSAIENENSVPVANQLLSPETSLDHFVNNNGDINENSSEEMKLSLVSWYSEPNESCFYQEGPYDEDEIRKMNCDKDCLSSYLSNTKVNSNNKASEKDIKTPGNNCKINNETEHKRKINKIINQSTSLEHIDVKYNTNTAATNDVKSKLETTSGKLECPRCSRRSKSSNTNTTTCSGPSGSSRRIIQSSKELSQKVKTPIKSILKPSGLSKSSNFNQRSSVDNLTRSSITDRNSNENNSSSKTKMNSTISEDKLASGLKRIEKYATLRPRKKGRVGPALRSSQEDVNESNCSYLMSKSTSTRNNVGCEANDLMTKSMSFLEKNSYPFRRQGSLILRNASPMPSGTRTSALRLMKIQEAKVKGSTNPQQHFANNGNVSIVESLQNKSLINPSVPSNSSNHIVFSKLASASGQTESSKLKRLRQERGVQTESLQSLQSDINNSISPIPLPESSADDTTKISSAEELFKWERLAKRYRNTALRFQYEYEKANARNQELNKQLNENQIEAKEMIEFLQAEKLTLAETLAESETELKNVNEKIKGINKEADLKHTNLIKLNEHYKQEALRAQSLLNKLEIHSNSKRDETNELKNSSLKIQHLKNLISSINDSLLEKYKLKQVSGNGLPYEEDVNLLQDIKIESKYRSLGPLVSFLSEAIKNLFNADELDDKEKIDKKLQIQISKIELGSNSKADAFEDSVTSLNSNLISLTSQTNSVDGIVNDFNALRIQAVKEREEAEHNGFDTYLEGITSTGAPSLIKNEIFELNEVFKIFLKSIKRILILYDGQAQATHVGSNILQCLKSVDEEQLVVKHQTETMQNSSPQTTTWNGKDSKSQSLIQNDQLTQGKECIFNGNGINSTSF